MSTPKGFRAKAPTRCARLRQLLGDWRWHTHAELTAAGGARFGARLEEIRNGWDGGRPILIDVRVIGGDDTRTEYRFENVNTKPKPRPAKKTKNLPGPCPTCGHLAEVRP